MIKYTDTLITFTEVPDEISLCINCSCCPLKCKGCFEPWLQTNCGQELTSSLIKAMRLQNPHITCICFMGGINDYKALSKLLKTVHEMGIKTALYSGYDFMEPAVELDLDYYKIGHFDPACGPLNLPTTNQKFYKKQNNQWIDITYRFLKRTS